MAGDTEGVPPRSRRKTKHVQGPRPEAEHWEGASSKAGKEFFALVLAATRKIETICSQKRVHHLPMAVFASSSALMEQGFMTGSH